MCRALYVLVLATGVPVAIQAYAKLQANESRIGPSVSGLLGVDAGPDQTITLPAGAGLAGDVVDDGLPNLPGAVTTAWSQVSGPGTVSFNDPAATDATTTFSEAGTYVLRLTADDGQLTASDETTITVQPASPSSTIEVKVVAGSDDAEEGATGSVSLTSTDLELVLESSTQTVGIRFVDVNVPQGATLTNAYVQFQVDEASSDPTSLTIQGEASDGAATFEGVTWNVSSRPRTAAAVSWSPPPWTTVADAGPDQRTPDIAPVIQEIVNRPGWASGNALAIIVTGSGKRVAEASEGTASPLLHLEFLGAAPPVVDEVHWTVTGRTSVTFDWRATNGGNRIDYGLTTAYGQTATGYTPSPLPFSSPLPFWEARLIGLQPDTLYHYSIAGGPDHTFRTPPAPGAEFTIAVEGDIGATRVSVAPRVQWVVSTVRPAFVLAVGDLTYGNHAGQTAVDQHFNDVMAWSLNAAYMPVWGNHEWDEPGDDLRNYKGRFDFPNPQTSPGCDALPYPNSCGGEDWYWFDYGNTRFIAYPEPYPGARSDWNARATALMDAAQADPDITFIVTFGHRPAYSSGHYSGAGTLRDYLDALGASHGKFVLNLSGHSHNYERTHPQSGVVHVTVGTGGAGLHPDSNGTNPCDPDVWASGCPPPDFTAFRAMRHGALRLRFTASAIEGSFLCGPAATGSDVNDVICNPGDVIDPFTIP
ncbi:MAG: metallophosphoesterase [Thermoanaerobaculia bacterium]